MSSTDTNTTFTTLEDLLSYDDEAFVENAYHVVLGRASDPEGMGYYLGRLQTGTSKVEILAQLGKGPEGRARQVKIAGLDEAILRQKRLKTPLLGGLLRLAQGHQTEKNRQRKPGAAQVLAIEHKKPSKVSGLLESHGLDEDALPPDLTLENIHLLNPFDHFDDIYEALSAIVRQMPVRKLRIHEEDEANASFYSQLALHHEGSGRHEQAIELYRLSLLFANTPKAHENLGNIALDSGRYPQAKAHYKIALDLNSKSHWVYVNLARAQDLSGQYEEAVKTISAGIVAHPGFELPLSRLDGHIDSYWKAKEQEIECIAESQNREKLIAEYNGAVTFISSAYAKVFRRNSTVPVNGTLNAQKVLIVGLTHDVPQCFRYRIEQKLEQLKYADYEAETVPWYDYDSALKLINFYDLIIFYRTPAFPGVLKLVEYAKSLGKITFYELDDLLFESVSVPPIETYGGQISLAAYTNITKDIGSYRSIAGRCDYAIASTLPLIEKLAPLTQTQIGYLHRNGLDKYNRQGKTTPVDKGYLNLFYGSGTTAHNTDFIIEALPAIARILKEFKKVKLTILGYLTLPEKFLAEFKGKVIQVPFTKEIEIYWAYLSASDINLAVLHDDVLTACKSELKWFEAANFSIPSVVSRTQNYLDVIRQGEDGFVASGEEEWYDTLKKLIENPGLRERIGSKAYERVKTEYSVIALAMNIDNIIKSAIHNRMEDSKKAYGLKSIEASE